MSEALPLVAAATAGLLGGVHCVGMCGGIVGALSLASDASRRDMKQQLPLLFGYNFGRIFSYVVAGAVFGTMGQLSGRLLPVQVMQAVLAIIAGTMMILMGLYIGGWNGLLRRVESAAGGLVWRRLEPLGRKLLPVRNPLHGVLLGTIWGWLPCGLVYSMLIWALGSGSAVNGALLLLAFGIGTLPNLIATGLLANQFSTWIQLPKVRVTAAILMIAFGLYTLYRGF